MQVSTLNLSTDNKTNQNRTNLGDNDVNNTKNYKRRVIKIVEPRDATAVGILMKAITIN